MKRILIIIPALLLAAPVAWALDGKDKEPPKSAQSATTPKGEFDALKSQYDQAMQERQKALEKYQAAQQQMMNAARQNMDFAEKNAKDATAFDALLWLVGNPPDMQLRQRAAAALVKDHLENEKIGEACAALAQMANGEQQVRAIMEKAKARKVQGPSRLALAPFFKQQATRACADAQKEKFTTDAVKMLEEIIANYGDVQVGDKKLGDTAKEHLAVIKALANLNVGNEVPDIVGPDVDGKQFKLSDYRGKVVLLDFWAHW